MAAQFQNHEIPQLEEGELDGATDEEVKEEIERLKQEENGRINEDEVDFRYEREKTEEGFRYVPDPNSGVFDTEEGQEINEEDFEIETELDFGREILYDEENQKMEIDMGPKNKRETYQVIMESREVFESPDSPIKFRNEKGNQEGIIDWYPLKHEITWKNCEGEKKKWKESSEYQEKKKLELFRDLRRQKKKFESAAEGKEWVLQNGDSAAQKAREYLIDNLCPMLKDRGRVNVAEGVKRLGEKGPKYGNLLQEFDTAVNRFEIKVRQEYGMDPDKIEIKHSNDKIVYEG